MVVSVMQVRYACEYDEQDRPVRAYTADGNETTDYTYNVEEQLISAYNHTI